MLIRCIVDVEKDADMKNLNPKEAVTILNDMKVDIPVPKAAATQIKKNLALDMAINALNCSEIPNNSDTIRRQDAIDAIEAKEANEFGNYVEYNVAFNDGLRSAVFALEDLSSAQPEPIRINLNEPIKVKLTGWGKEIYYHQYDRINRIAGREICKPKFPKEDENGYTKFQLWCFMELYGEHMGMTLPNVIEPLEIVYER